MKTWFKIILAVVALAGSIAWTFPVYADDEYLMGLIRLYAARGDIRNVTQTLKEHFPDQETLRGFNAWDDAIRTLIAKRHFSAAYEFSEKLRTPWQRSEMRRNILHGLWAEEKIDLEELELKSQLDLDLTDQRALFRSITDSLIGRENYTEAKLFLRKYSNERWAREMMQQLAFAVSRENIKETILMFSEPGINTTSTIIRLADHRGSSKRITDDQVAYFLSLLRTPESRSSFLYSLATDAIVNKKDGERAKYFISLVPLEEIKTKLLAFLRDMKK